MQAGFTAKNRRQIGANESFFFQFGGAIKSWKVFTFISLVTLTRRVKSALFVKENNFFFYFVIIKEIKAAPPPMQRHELRQSDQSIADSMIMAIVEEFSKWPIASLVWRQLLLYNKDMKYI